MLGIKSKHEDTVKANLLHLRQSRILEMFSQNHGEGWGCHWHWPVTLRCVNTLTAYNNQIKLFGFFWIDTKDDLFVMRHVGFFHIRS